MFLVGLTAFGVGSLLCGLAPSIGWLVAARVVQAAGGTMLNPVALAIVATVFADARERARAIGVIGAVSGLALALGPICGGALVDGFGWRSVFWINVPVVAIAVAATLRYVPESRAPRARRFDPVGQVLVVALLGAVAAAIIEAHGAGWGSPPVLGLLALALLAAVGIARYEPRRVDPLLELRLFRSVPFTAAMVTALCALCAFGSFLFVITQYLQDQRGLSAFEAGLHLLPVGLTVLVVAPLSGRVVGRRGPRIPLVVAGLAVVPAGVAALWLGPATPLLLVLVVAVLVGLFLGAVNPPITNSAVAGMPRSMAGMAGSLASVGRQTGTTLGVAIAGAGTVAGVGWLMIGLGATIVALGIVGTGARARATADRAATLFDEVDIGTRHGASHS